ncbi:hypothetical protein JCM16303_002363 [Sporobolomyces ruberrimus]
MSTNLETEANLLCQFQDQKDIVVRDIHSKAKVALNERKSTLILDVGSSNSSGQGLGRNWDEFSCHDGNIHTETNTLVLAPIESVYAQETVQAWERSEKELFESGKLNETKEPSYTSDTLPNGYFLCEDLRKGSDVAQHLKRAYAKVSGLRRTFWEIQVTSKIKSLQGALSQKEGELKAALQSEARLNSLDWEHCKNRRSCQENVELKKEHDKLLLINLSWPPDPLRFRLQLPSNLSPSTIPQLPL